MSKMMEPALAGRTAVVTGGARGLGYAMAEALAHDGADVVLLDRLENVADSAHRLAEKSGVRTLGLVAGELVAHCHADIPGNCTPRRRHHL